MNETEATFRLRSINQQRETVFDIYIFSLCTQVSVKIFTPSEKKLAHLFVLTGYLFRAVL